MPGLRKFAFILILLLSGTLFANQNGIKNCDYIFNSLKKSNFQPISQSLVSSGNNIFPYNIYFRLKTEENTQNQNNFLLVIQQKDFQKNQSLILSILNELKNTDTSQNIIVLFSYADDFVFNNENTINGSSIFLDSIDYKDSLTALLLDFDEETNNVSSGTDGCTSPSAMVTAVYNNCVKSKIKFQLPIFYFSQTYSYKISFDKYLNTYISQKIPAIRISLKSIDKYNDEALMLIKNICSDLLKVNNNQFDQHFLIIRTPAKYIRITEKNIVIIIILIILTFLLFLFLFTFVNNNIQKESWNNTKKMWYFIPATYSAILLSLIAGKYFSILVFKNYSAVHQMMMTATFQFIFAVVITAAYNILETIFNKNFNNDSLDYMIIFCTFLNQFIFLFVDVAFFPIFMVLCILAIASYVIHNRYVKICFAFIMFIPYVLYGNQLLTISCRYRTEFSFIYNIHSFIFLSFSFCPIFIFIFQIINSFIKNKENKKNIILLNSIVSAVFIAGSLLFSTLFYIRIKKDFTTVKTQIILDEDNSNLKINSKDKKIFDNTIRTLTIQVPENTVNCKLIVNSENSKPVLYSDNSFKNISEKTAEFLIPAYPPEKMSFSYGIGEKSSTVKLIVYTETNENEFNRLEKSFIIE